MSPHSIHIDPPLYAQHHVPAERLKGTVELGEGAAPRALEVRLGYEILGKDQTEHIERTQAFGPADLRARSVAFEFDLPHESPSTYDGQLIQVRWFVEVRCDGDQGRAPERAPFVLRGAQGAGPLRPQETIPAHFDLTDNDYGAGCLLPTALIVLGLLLCGVWPMLQASPLAGLGDALGESPVLYFLGALVWGLSVLVLVFMLRRWMASRLLESVSIELRPWPLRVGGQHLYVMDILPSRSFDIHAATVTLTCNELVSYQDGDDTTIEPCVVFEQVFTLCEEASLRKGERVRWTTQIQLPHDAPMSFGSKQSGVEWTLETLIDVRRWPDWEDIHDIRVLARGGDAPLPAETTGEPIPW